MKPRKSLIYGAFLCLSLFRFYYPFLLLSLPRVDRIGHAFASPGKLSRRDEDHLSPKVHFSLMSC
jgi:hypothetical protein